ncbi:MAG TPA: energy transducer TonB [Terriglobales bacterium]|nr:energy transducer TonB [Terriglobales bacterium]
MANSENLTLGLLPERKMDWRTLASSYGVEIFAVFLLVNIGLIWPDRLQLTQNFHVTELIPLPSLHTEPPPRPKAPPMKVKLLPPAKLPVPVETPHLTVPREVRVVKQKPAEVEAPKIAMNNFPAPKLEPVVGGARLARVVHTGQFGSSATPTVNAPIQKVQTGGFGDPNGLPGTGKEGAHLTAAKLGSFDLPEGPGQGNGTGGAHGIKGTVASAGFGNGIAVPGNGDGRSNGRGAGVQTGGFGSQEVAQAKPKTIRELESGPATSPVEILYKPNPVYTQEARALKLEGEVLLEVMFGANGHLQVNRVARGLGHGLDEAAVSAADKIRFKPAQRNGSPVDSTAIVHVVFQLAY